MSERVFLKGTSKRIWGELYKVIDSSITTKILTPFWNWLVTFVPSNVAPNVLTLAAFAFGAGIVQVVAGPRRFACDAQRHVQPAFRLQADPRS